MTSKHELDFAKSDTRVACPIVCGKHLRASGFFYRSDSQVYLITARHNLLPTRGEELATGELSVDFDSGNRFATLDVYLRSEDEYEVTRYDIRDLDGVRHTSTVDAVAIPLPLDPTEYGYTVWGPSDIVSLRVTEESMEVIGFSGQCFPDGNCPYERSVYREEITEPTVLPLGNQFDDPPNPEQFGALEVGQFANSVGNSAVLNGLSGAPVLAGGLAGVHSNTAAPRSTRQASRDSTPDVATFTRADVLPLLFK